MNTTSPYDLIVFDCDGVLVDSEALACVIHAEVLTQHGYAITAEQVHERFLGRSAREARFEVESELGFALPARSMNAPGFAWLAAATGTTRTPAANN